MTHFAETFQDSLLIILYDEKLPNNNVLSISIFSKQDLSLKSNFVVDTITPNVFGSIKLLKDSNKEMYIVFDQEENGLEQTRFFTIDPSYQKVNKAFTISNPTSFRLVTIGILDQDIYMLRSNRADPGYYLNTVLSKYNMQGNLILSKIQANDTLGSINSTDTMFTSAYRFGPYQHPSKPNIMVFGSEYDCQVIQVDKQSLELKRSMKRTSLGIDYSFTFVYGFGLWPGKITCGGTGTEFNGNINNPALDKQYIYMERDWDQNTLYVRAFGPKKVANATYTYAAVKNPESHIIAGSVPFEKSFISADEYRQVLIYQFTNQGIGDSLILFGNKNHVPMQIIPDTATGDLYMTSVYSEAWTDDQQFIQLTKIPGFAIGLVHERKISPYIYVYPNPAVNNIRLKGYQMGIEKLEIYTQTGVKVFEQNNPQEEIDISQLDPNIYVVLLTNRKGEVSSSLLQKQ